VSGNFQGADRPHQILLAFSNGHRQTLTLDDNPAPQEVTLKPGGAVTGITWTVTSLYREGASDSVAVTEIELFRRK
jgi:hypothetical protein